MIEYHAVGVDIGGTKVEFVIIDGGGNVLAEHRIATEPHSGEDVLIERVAHEIDQLIAKTDHDIIGIGVGSPGYVNSAAGVVRFATNLGWENVRLRDKLTEALLNKRPVTVHNDLNAAAFGELAFGRAKSHANFVYLALGTGLGGAAFVNGQLVEGAEGAAMDVGHMGRPQYMRRCACGQVGCPEMYVSGTGLLAAVTDHKSRFPESPLAITPNPSTFDIIQAARQGDPMARFLLNEVGEHLGAVLTTCATLLNPSLMIVGGGLGHAVQQWILPVATTYLDNNLSRVLRANMRVEMAQVERIAVGAASVALIEANKIDL